MIPMISMILMISLISGKENSSGNKAREAETGFMPIVEAERKGYGTETERKDS